MKVSTGFSLSKDASVIVLEIAEQIRTTSVNKYKNDILLAFCSSSIDYSSFFTQLRNEFKETPVIGGGVIGVITNHQYEYSNPVSGVMLIQGDDYIYRFGYVKGFNKNEIESGEKLIDEIGVEEDDRALMIFFESAASEACEGHPPVLNHSTLLCDGIYKKMPETTMLTGAGLVGDLSFGKSFQFCGDAVCKDSALGLMFCGPVRAFSRVFHGCTPLDGIYHTITKVTNNGIIEELDGEPVVGIIDNIFRDKSWRNENPLKLLTLGINKGEKYCDFIETNYVNRLIVGISPDEKGIIPIEPFFHEGDEIQFMLRDNNRMIETAGQGAQALMDKILFEHKKPYFAFYINCSGRAGKYCNSLNEEAIEVQNIMNKHHIPLLGIYSGVEIAPYNNRSIGLDWTGVLFILTEE
ncbi:MAG: FIST C-terminal domain-containing protein [Spirochaetes bacterium]|nr:FIST C-terminal domain-containing protein [Spirochaetota bacterium]